MDDKQMLKWSCRRIREMFRGLDVDVNPYYHYRENNGRSSEISIDVTLEFTIPQKNLTLLDSHMAEIRKLTKELTEDGVYDEKRGTYEI